MLSSMQQRALVADFDVPNSCSESQDRVWPVFSPWPVVGADIEGEPDSFCCFPFLFAVKFHKKRTKTEDQKAFAEKVNSFRMAGGVAGFLRTWLGSFMLHVTSYKTLGCPKLNLVVDLEGKKLSHLILD